MQFSDTLASRLGGWLFGAAVLAFPAVAAVLNAASV